ncbi:MAG TPA: hypothetical protein VE196_07385, partial [Pseudonocardiaceae bacterium]|nr:hypothetical protein [Pseudonocardiaceae bacterium]
SSVTRVTAGLLLSAVAVLAHLVPGLAVLTVTVAILITVNVWEHWIISTGRSVPLLSRSA